jgi:hypothetical protein
LASGSRGTGAETPQGRGETIESLTARTFADVFPGGELVHVFAVTTTLWRWTTVAPIPTVMGVGVAPLFTPRSSTDAPPVPS